MTREQAIQILKYNSNVIHKTINGETDPNEVEALDIAISALEHPERNVVAIVPCGDAISRQEAIDTIRQLYIDLATQKYVIDLLKVLPSVTPQKSFNPMVEINLYSAIKHKYIEREVLDKLRAEIEQNAYPIVHGVNNHEKGMTLYGILQIIDKYKAEKEE